MKLLVAGGCVFLGYNIVAGALKKGYQVFVIDALFRLGSHDNKCNYGCGLFVFQKSIQQK